MAPAWLHNDRYMAGHRVALLLISSNLHPWRAYLGKFSRMENASGEITAENAPAAIIGSWQRYVVGPLIADDGGRTSVHTFLCSQHTVENIALPKLVNMSLRLQNY